MKHTIEPNPLTPSPITSIQPGGGTCMALELAWGKIRRAILRLCFPGYVREMASQIKGDLAGCPHPVIDGRDLKFYRNVCKASIPVEADRFAWRGRIGFARAGLAELVIFNGILLFMAMATAHMGYWYHPAWNLLLPVWLVLMAFVFWFFRDPERAIPEDTQALISPADGKITHIEEVADSDFPEGKALRISIFLSVFNVHVNRLPRSGSITRLTYYPGEYLDARSSECAKRNEQFLIDMKDKETGGMIRVKQVAGAIARRIVCWLREGEEVTRGDRLGMIKFGSRTDILLSPQFVEKVMVKVGQKVTGGSTIILRMRQSQG